MLYVQLDANWPDDEKVMDAGWEAAGVHAGIMCIAKRLNTDGWVPLRTCRRYEMPEHAIERLAENDLLEFNDDGTQVRVHNWLKRNPSKAAIAAKRDAKVRAGKAGNHTKHGHLGNPDTCRICWPPEEQNPSVLAPAIADSRSPLAKTSHPSSLIDIDTAAIAASDRPDPAAYQLADEETAAHLEWIKRVRAETGRTKAAS